MSNPAELLKDVLETAGVGVFAATSGWSIAVDQEPPEPDTVITLYNTGGVNPNPKWLIDFPSVQVRIRGAVNGYLVSRAKAQQVKDTLLGLPSQVVAGERINSITGIGDIVNAGRDDNNRPLCTVNFATIIEPSSGTNRIPL